MLNKPAELSFEVTGIGGTKDTSNRVSLFKWRYADRPSLLRRVAIEGGSGTASFERSTTDGG